ncbi:MAG: hypothetical protein ABSH00_11370 [Bryobacteraceae bacterium]|jgi:hypothetical protein
MEQDFLWSHLTYDVTGTGGADVGAFSISGTTSELTVQFSKLNHLWDGARYAADL